MADGNAFSNSLYQWGQYMLNNPQGTGRTDPNQPLQNPAQQAPMPATMPTNIAPPPPVQAQPVNAPPLETPTASFPQPGGAGVPQLNVKAPQLSSGQGGGQQQRPGGAGGSMGGTPGGAGGGYSADTLGNLGDEGLIGSMGLGQGFGGGGGGAGGGGGGMGVGNALSGISSALQSAGQQIASTPTQATPINSGPFPGINQQPATLVGRRTQTPFYG